MVGQVGGSQHTVMVALPGSDVQGRVPVVVDSMEVAASIQEDLSDGCAASEGGPVQADVFLLWRWVGGGMGAGSRALEPSLHLAQGSPIQTELSRTLSVRVTSAPRVSNMRITSMCLCSAAQMMGVHPPLSCGWGGRSEGGAQQPALSPKQHTVKSIGSGVRAGVSPRSTTPCCGALGTSLYISGSQFPQLQNGTSSVYRVRLWNNFSLSKK